MNKKFNNLNNFKLVLKISFIYISSILGAGFATGHELVTFFAVYSNIGIFTFLLSCVVVGLFASGVLYSIDKIKPISYSQLLRKIYGNKLGKFMELLNIMFMFVLFSAMLSGGGNVLASIFNHDSTKNFQSLEHIHTIMFSIFIIFTLIICNDNLLKVNNILCPIILIGGIFIGCINIPSNYFSSNYIYNNNFSNKNFIIYIIPSSIACIIYSSYNLITTIAILYTFSKRNINKMVIKYTGVVSGILIFLSGIFLLIALISNINLVYDKELPILFLVQNNIYLKIIYETILLIAIFTTAISNGFALLDIFINKLNLSKKWIILIISILGVGFAMIGFSNIVDIVYPIFGYLGIFQVIVIILNFIFKKY